MGLFKTLDGGESWRPSGSFQGQVRAVYLPPDSLSEVFVGVDGGQVYRSADLGRSWEDISKGLPVDIKAEPLTFRFIHYDGSSELRTDYKWAATVFKLEGHPSRPGELYAATPFGLFKFGPNDA